MCVHEESKNLIILESDNRSYNLRERREKLEEYYKDNLESTQSGDF